jgi:SAM-dependent methyltransferase
MDELYTPEYYEMLLTSYRRRHPLVVRRIEQVAAYLELRPDDVVLETGCGPGLTAMELAPRCRRVFAIDDVPLALAFARREPTPANLFFLHADLARLPFPDEVFTKVAFSEVVEHLHEPAVVLNELFRVLRPGGLMAVTTWPSLACLSWRLNYAHGRGSPQDFHPQTPRSLRRLLCGAGFEVVKTRFDSFYLRVPIFGRELHGNVDGTRRQRWLESLVRGPWAPLVGSSIKMQARRGAP